MNLPKFTFIIKNSLIWFGIVFIFFLIYTGIKPFNGNKILYLSFNTGWIVSVAVPISLLFGYAFSFYPLNKIKKKEFILNRDSKWLAKNMSLLTGILCIYFLHNSFVVPYMNQKIVDLVYTNQQRSPSLMKSTRLQNINELFQSFKCAPSGIKRNRVLGEIIKKPIMAFCLPFLAFTAVFASLILGKIPRFSAIINFWACSMFAKLYFFSLIFAENGIKEGRFSPLFAMSIPLLLFSLLFVTLFYLYKFIENKSK